MANRKRSSLTAAGIAAVRALERERPPGSRIVDDPYARAFAGEGLYRIMRFFDRLGWSERRGRGVIGYLVARERAIDDFLLRMLAEGMQQVVILGAGYDARAWRLAPALDGVHVFEVDQAATQMAKQKKIGRLTTLPETNVTFVAVDFETESLSERLKTGGYDSSQRTVFIWQGVVPYLTPAAVDATLAFIREDSAPGSALIFDYVAAAMISGATSHPEIRSTNAYGRLSGEVLGFGLDPDAVPAFLAARGFVDVVNVRSEALHDRYFEGPNASREVTPGFGIVSARVPA